MIFQVQYEGSTIGIRTQQGTSDSKIVFDYFYRAADILNEADFEKMRRFVVSEFEV